MQQKYEKIFSHRFVKFVYPYLNIFYVASHKIIFLNNILSIIF